MSQPIEASNEAIDPPKVRLSENRADEQAQMKADLERKGHFAMTWNDLDYAELPSGVITTMFKVGMPDNDGAPTVFKVYYPPNCIIEAHTHACDYTEIVIEGSQRVGATWHKAGDIRIGLANRGYGPLVSGPEGTTVLFVFADGRWPAIILGNNDGATLGSDLIAQHFEPNKEIV